MSHLHPNGRVCHLNGCDEGVTVPIVCPDCHRTIGTAPRGGMAQASATDDKLRRHYLDECPVFNLFRRSARHAEQVPAARTLTHKVALTALALGFALAGTIADLTHTRAGRVLGFVTAVVALVAAIVGLAVVAVLVAS